MGRETPNPKNVAIVAEVAERLEGADTIIATEYRGLNVPQQAALRSAIKDAGGELKIYKNTLVRRAAEQVNVDITDHLTGPTALALTNPGEGETADPAALAKALQNFAEDNPAFIIKGGVMDGAPLDGTKVEALSKIPSREVLLSQIAGLFAAPMSKFASLLQAMPRDLASLIKALEEQGGAGEASADASADATDDAAADEPTSSDDAAPESEEAAASDDAVESEDSAEESTDAEASADASGEEEE